MSGASIDFENLMFSHYMYIELFLKKMHQIARLVRGYLVKSLLKFASSSF